MQYLIVANSVPGEPPAPRCWRLGSLVRTRTMKCMTMFAGDELFLTSAEEEKPQKYPDSVKSGGNF